MKKLLQIFTIIVIIIGFSGLCMSYVATIVYADDGYPVGYPIDTGYPVWGYPSPIDYGYPIDTGYPIFEGYPDPLYPEPVSDTYQLETVSELTFAKEYQAEIEEVKEVIENIQPFEKSRVYQTWKQVKEIVRHYVGKMIKFAR